MIQALKSNLNFNETVCGELVDNIIGLSRSNCYELRYGFVKEEDEIPSKTWSCSYWDFVNLMFGGFNTSRNMLKGPEGVDSFSGNAVNALFFTYKNTENAHTEGTGNASDNVFFDSYIITGNTFGEYDKNFVKFGYYIGNDFYEVCDAHQNGSAAYDEVYYTPSQVAFFQCLLSVDTKMGYGLNFLDLFEGDLIGASGEKVLENLESAVNQTNNSMTPDDVYALSAYSNRVYVDCFGNLIRYGGSHQTIIMPGCMNPYTWVGVQSNGEDYDISSDIHKRGVVVLSCIQNLSCLNTEKLIGSDRTNEGNGIYSVNFNSPHLLSVQLNSERYASVKAQFYIDSDFDDSLATAKYIDELVNELNIESSNSSSDGVTIVYIFGNTETNSLIKGYKWNLYSGDSTMDFDSITTGNWIWNGSDSSGEMLKLIKHSVNTTDIDTRWLKFDTCAYNRNGLATTEREKVILGGMFKNLNNVGNQNHSGKSYLATNMCFIDDLGAFGFESSNSDIAYDTIQIKSILNNDGSASSELAGISSISSSSSLPFSSVLDSVKRGQINVVNVADSRLMVSLYTTYAIAGLYDDSSKAETIGKLGYRINREGLPKISNSPLLISQSYADEQIKKDLLNMLYYLFKPDAVDYIRIAIKNKLQAILVGWHNDMVGTSGTGATLGTTYYRTNYGYVTTPDLSEIQWTSSLINVYNRFVPLLVVFMVLSMLASFVTGVMSLQKCALGVIVFSTFLLVPVNAINLVVSKSNAFTNKIYGDKFVYWALVQEQTFGSAIDTAATGALKKF